MSIVCLFRAPLKISFTEWTPCLKIVSYTITITQVKVYLPGKLILVLYGLHFSVTYTLLLALAILLMWVRKDKDIHTYKQIHVFCKTIKSGGGRGGHSPPPSPPPMPQTIPDWNQSCNCIQMLFMLSIMQLQNFTEQIL